MRTRIQDIARKHDGIGIMGIDTVEGTGENRLARVRIGADMDIGKLYDAVAVECSRQVFERIIQVLDLQTMKPDGAAIDQHIDGIEG